MKKLLFGLFLCGCGSQTDLSIETSKQQPLIIYCQNQSSWSQQAFTNYIKAQNLQLERDFAPQWNIHAALVEGRGDYELTVLQDFDYLDFSPFKNQPTAQGVHLKHKAYANLKTSKTVEASCSHEVLEMLVNPENDSNGKEVCDPVAPYAYDVYLQNGPKNVEDFVWPGYFVSGYVGQKDQMWVLK